MDIQQLRYIIALSEELHFNRAAQKVGISQPTLSQQIKKLEDELREPLFERSSKSVRLTQAGEMFIPYARSALENLKNGIEQIGGEQDSLSGIVHVAFIPTIGPYILPKVLSILKKEAPNLVLKLYEETTSVLTENLKHGKFDLGLLALPISDQSIVNRKLIDEEFYLAVAASDPLANRKSVSVQDIEDRKLLMLQEGHCFRDQALDFCHIDSKDARLVFEGSSLVSVLNLVATGEGITFVPKMAVQSMFHRNLKYIPFRKQKPIREIGIIWRMTMPLNKVQKYFMDVVERVLKKST